MDDTLHALADPIRREILRMVRDAALPAGTIAAAFPVSRPAVSRHLRVLRTAGLVRDQVLGRERVYRLELAPLARAESFFTELRAPRDIARITWERRLLSLETEVYRVRAGGKAKRTKPMDDTKRRTG